MADNRGGNKPSAAGSWTTVLALVGQLGFSIACPMVFFIGGGAWLDNRIGWGPWLLFLGIILGVGVAGGLFYQLATLPTRKQAREKAKADAPYKVEQERSKLKNSNLKLPRKSKRDGNDHRNN